MVLVEVAHSAQHVSHNLHGLFFWHQLVNLDVLLSEAQKVTALAQLSNQIIVLFVLKNLLKADNIRMVQVDQHKCLCDEL